MRKMVVKGLQEEPKEEWTERIWVKPTDSAFSYEGRIDFERAETPIFVYACSHFRFRLRGRNAALAVENLHGYFENALGVLVDGAYRGKILLHDGIHPQGETVEQYLLRMDPKNAAELILRLPQKDADVRMYDLSPFLDGAEHELTIFKRMDACHYFAFHGLVAEAGARPESAVESPDRRIEVYGDSVSCGEVSEAVGRCGMSDPEGHNGIYSNGFYSYSWILARKLGARLHDVAQGGISLLDGEGYFDMPDTKGMLSCYDKIQYNPSLGSLKQWDFERYVPHVVIVAIGQNDAHPVNYMAEDYDGEKAILWRREYRRFIGILREKYPRAQILLTTTILGHDPAWDEAIESVCREWNDPKVHHFLYSRNGCGTCGHIRIPEAEKMAEELKAFIDGLGEDVWKD